MPLLEAPRNITFFLPYFQHIQLSGWKQATPTNRE
jgi:hypothetical protein